MFPDPFSGLVVHREECLAYHSKGIQFIIETPIQSIVRKPPPPQQICNAANNWTIAGQHTTNSDGIAVIHLIKCICEPPDDTGESEASNKYITGTPFFTATPVIDEPVLLTTQFVMEPIENAHQLTCTPLDPMEIKIKVTSWDTKGKKIGKIPFTWLCVVQAVACEPGFGG